MRFRDAVRREVGSVDAGRDRPHRGARRESGQEGAVSLGDCQRQLGLSARLGLVASDFAPLELQEGALPRGRGPAQALPDHVLDVVLEEHDRDRAG